MKSSYRPTRPLGVGVQLPEVERVVRWPEIKAMALEAEAVGFDSLWLGDHLLYRDADGAAVGPWEMWSMLASLAAITQRVSLGPLVAATSFHSPAMLAKKAATIDEISGGRLVLGLGAGWNELEYRAFGFAFDHRVSRFEEAFTIIRRLLDHETVDFDGRYYRIEGCELQPRRALPGSVPIMIGSIGPRMLRITMPHVQMWNAWYNDFGNSPAGAVPLLERLDRACESAGRDPSDIDRSVAVLVQAPGGSGRAAGEESKPGMVPISGPPEGVADALREFAALGIDHVQLVLDPITIDSIAWCADVLAVLDKG